MASLSTLVNDGSSLDGLVSTASGDSSSVSDGAQFVFSSAAGSGNPAFVQSSDSYDATGGSVHIQYLGRTVSGSADFQVVDAAGNGVGIRQNRSGSSEFLSYGGIVAGVYTAGSQAGYDDPDLHAWWRILHDAGADTWRMQTSPAPVDGVFAWTTRYSRVQADLSRIAVFVRFGQSGSSTGATVTRFDNLNTVPAPVESAGILPYLPLLAGDSDMRDLYYSPDGSADRLSLEYDAWNDDGTPTTGIEDVTPALRINGGTASDTHAAAAAVEVRVGRYRVTVLRASVEPGDDVLVASFTGADYLFGGEGRVVAPNVATDAATTTDVADALLVRNIAGGANGGHTVGRALKKVVNKKVLVNGVLTVYEEDGETPAFTEAITGTSTVTAADPS